MTEPEPLVPRPAGDDNVFISSGQRGFSPAIAASPRCVHARKREQEIEVRFTAVPCEVETREGVVHAVPGDAIITGTHGEHWRVSRARFLDKYRPVPPTVSGGPGRYVSLPNAILALSMERPFQVVLADGKSRLRGLPGDWLVDYGDGSLGIVSKEIFAATYEVAA